MRESIHEKVDVVVTFTRAFGGAFPKRVRWQGKEYNISEVGMHHMVREGRILHHIFSVTANTLFFRLDFNTETLQWQIAEISDGLPS